MTFKCHIILIHFRLVCEVSKMDSAMSSLRHRSSCEQTFPLSARVSYFFKLEAHYLTVAVVAKGSSDNILGFMH